MSMSPMPSSLTSLTFFASFTPFTFLDKRFALFATVCQMLVHGGPNKRAERVFVSRRSDRIGVEAMKHATWNN